jgi:virulence factor Mce-like protein
MRDHEFDDVEDDIRERLTDGLSRERVAIELKRSIAPAIVTLVGGLLGLAAFGFIVAKTSGSSFHEQTTLRFAVSDATAVVPAGRDEVRFHGIPAGTITKVQLEEHQPVLTVKLRASMGPIYRNARAQLRPNTALQDMYLDIVDRGTPSAGRAQAGDPLPASRTATSVNVAEVLQTFDPDTRAHLSTVLRDLGQGLGGRGDELRQAFVEVTPFLRVAGGLSRQLATRSASTRRLVTNTASLTAALGRRDKQLRRLVDEGGATLDTLAAGSPDLNATLLRLPPTLQRLDSSFTAVRGVLGDVDHAVDALRPVAGELPGALPAVRRLADHAGPAVRALQRPVQQLQPLARDLQPLAQDLSTGLAALQPQVGDLDHVTRSVAGCKVPLQRFFQWTPSVFKMGDAKGVGPRADVTLAVESAGIARDPRLFAGKSCAPGKQLGGVPAPRYDP